MTRSAHATCAGALRRASARRERGVAMLMVIIALTVTAILTGALIGGREHAPVIGANASKLAAAKWSAESAANVAVASLGKLDTMVADLADPGVALDDLQLGGAHVKVFLTDLSGDPPTADDRELILWAYAEIDGLIREVKKHITISPPGTPEDAIDFTLGEFAVFAERGLRVHERAEFKSWPLSPEMRAKTPMNVGVGFSSDADLDVAAGAQLGAAALYADADASGGLLGALGALGGADFWQIPLDVPAMAEAPVPALTSLLGGGADATYGLGDTVVAPPGAYGRIEVGTGAKVALTAGAGGMYGFDGLLVDGGMVVVSGEAEIIVGDRVEVRNGGSIVLADDAARIRLHVLDDLVVDGGSLGVLESDAGLAPDGLSVYTAPDRVLVFAPDATHGGTNDQQFELTNSSAVVASIHAPTADVAVRSGAALMGRMTAAYATIGDGGRLWYCPTLDARIGFCEATGPLYDSGLPIDGLVDAIGAILGVDGTLADKWLLMFGSWTPEAGDSGGGVLVFDDGGDMTSDDNLNLLEIDSGTDGGLSITSPLGELTIFQSP